MNRIYMLGTAFLLLILAGCSSNPNPVLPSDNLTDNFANSNYAASNPTSLYYYSMAESALLTGDTPLGLAMLERADEAAPENIFVKEEIINLLSILAYNDANFNQEIINRVERYISTNTYNSKILAKAANAQAHLKNYIRGDEFYKKAISEEPAMWLYYSYYNFRGLSTGLDETELLKKALKQPWKQKEIVLMVIETLLRTDSEAALEATRKGYKKWDDLNFFRELISALAAKNENEEVLALIEDRLDRGRDTPENYTTYLLGYYLTNLQIDKILKYKEIALTSNSSELWRILFFSAASEGEFKTAIYAGNLMEETNQIPEEYLVPFYTAFSEIYFQQENYLKCIEYLLKLEGWDVTYEFFSIFPYESEKEQYINLFDTFAESSIEPDKLNYILGTMLSFLDNPEALDYFNKIPDEYIFEEDLLMITAIHYLRYDTNLEKVYSLLNSPENSEDKDLSIPSADSFIGAYYYQNKKDTLAYSHFKKAVLEGQIMETQVYLVLANLGEKLSKLDEVAMLLYKGTKLNSETELLNIFGYYVADWELETWYSQAETALLEAIKLDPQNAMFWDSLAWLYYRENKHEEALEAMDIPSALAHEESEIAYHLGMILLKLDERDKAKSYFIKTIEIDNQKEAVDKSKKILKDQF